MLVVLDAVELVNVPVLEVVEGAAVMLETLDVLELVVLVLVEVDVLVDEFAVLVSVVEELLDLLLLLDVVEVVTVDELLVVAKGPLLQVFCIG